MTDWYVYMLRCADESLYTGIATDLEARVAKHNTGKAAKYTRSRRPVVLVYQETAADRSAAQRREAEIKQLRPEVKRQLVSVHDGVSIQNTKPTRSSHISRSGQGE